MSMKFCYKCGSVPKTHKCGSVSNSSKKSDGVNHHRRFRKLREYILVRDDGECVRHRIKFDEWIPDTVEKPLQAHHLKPQHKYNGKYGYPDLRWNENNIVMLCEDCHDVFDKGNVEELDFDYEFPPLY